MTKTTMRREKEKSWPGNLRENDLNGLICLNDWNLQGCTFLAKLGQNWLPNSFNRPNEALLCNTGKNDKQSEIVELLGSLKAMAPPLLLVGEISPNEGVCDEDVDLDDV